MSQLCSSAFINLNFLQFAKQGPLHDYYKCIKINRVCTFLNYENTERFSMKFRVTRAGVCDKSAGRVCILLVRMSTVIPIRRKMN